MRVRLPLPNVVRLLKMVSFVGMRSTETPRFSKKGLGIRDKRKCQVADCGDFGSTVDHLVPRSRGGDTSWENCVLMCRAHNSTKGDRTLEQLGWELKQRPVAPRGSIVMLSARPEWEGWLLPA